MIRFVKKTAAEQNKEKKTEPIKKAKAKQKIDKKASDKSKVKP